MTAHEQHITLNMIGDRERSKRYKTLAKAREAARVFLGDNPRLDPDGYAVSRVNGDCLFVIGVDIRDVVEFTP